MRILFLVPYVPSPIRFRSYNLVLSLASLGHQVTVMAVVSGKEERVKAEDLRRKGLEVIALPLSRPRSLANCLAALPTRFPLQAVYSWSPALARRCAELALDAGVARFDVVHVEHLRGSRYGLYLKSLSVRRRLVLPIVWDSVDCISLLFRQAASQGRSRFSRLVTRFELRRTGSYEAHLLRQFSEVLITSPIDRQSLLSLLPPGDPRTPTISIIPIGVDLDYFRPNPEIRRDPATLVISGKMSYHANVAMVSHLVEEVMPRIWARRRDVRVLVVGKAPPPKIRAFARNPLIRVTGTVDDVRPYLQTATLAVAPVIYGAGMQSKVLEAMACETAVVTTPKAMQALQGNPGEALLVAGEADGFAEGVLELLENPVRREALGRAGRAYVERYYPWSTIAGQLADRYRAAIRQANAPQS